MLEFKRWLNQDLVDALNKVKGNWWNKIIHDKDLHLGIRYNYLDVYYLGNQLFNINLLKDNGLCCTTHYKYLLHPKEKLCYLSFSADGTLSRDDFSDLFIRNLNNDDALNLIKKASQVHAGKEKTGIQQILNSNYNIIDVEIAFSQEKEVIKRGECELEKAPGKKFLAPRIDFVALQPNRDKVDLVFFEAKHFSNAEIKAEREAKVIRQINTYKGVIEGFKKNIENSYRRVCDNLLNLNGVLDGDSEFINKRKNLLQQVVDGYPLEVSSDVRLVIFGFDNSQKKDEVWVNKHLAKLKNKLKDRVLLRGDPKEFTNGISSNL